MKREQACKPNSVPRRTGMAIIRLAPTLLAGSSDLPESCAERAAPSLLFGLAPCGVYPASDVAVRAVRSYFKSRRTGPHLFTLTRPPPGLSGSETGRYVFCGTFRIGKVRPLRTSPSDPRC